MLKIEIHTDHDAFSGDPNPELARILREAADKIADGRDYDFPLRDINGGTVGSVTFS